MFTAYITNGDNSITILGGSDKEETLYKILPDIDFEVTDVEPILINGKYYLDDTTAEAQEQALIEAKVIKIAELKQARDTEEVTLVEYNGNTFDYDSKARERINIAYQTLQLSPTATISWTTANETEVVMSAEDFAGLLSAVALRSNELHVHYRELKERVNICNTIEEVTAINWEGNEVNG